VYDFYKLVRSGGQVNEKTLINRLKKAKLLAFGYADDGNLIAVTSIKVPNNKYKNDVFINGSIKESTENYSYELGYAVTHKEHRGKGYNFKLNKELISKVNDGNIYATTGNPFMVKLLKKLNFKPIGQEYDGKYNEKLQIYALDIM
ncbi:MAG: hypothetical protein JKZ00_00190, partial [Flavobacteriaceae bacterium]|nr:hypothetical protein [Flavobacteriaceae bacterium]